jgi:solute carrier family 35 protein E1
VVRAAADARDAPKASPVKLTAYVLGWYAFNIIFNIANKKSLTAFPCPWFISTLQLAASGLIMVFMWITKLQPVPKGLDSRFWKAILPVAAFHTLGHVAACTSFGQMAVSFAHIVKSAEPVLSVILSGPILGDTYPWYVWLSLLPIVAGCGLSAMKEVSFAWNGFNNAMLSNLGMVLRNIYSKRALKNFNIGGINLFGILSISSLIYCVPLSIIMEGSMWAGAYNNALVAVGSTEFYKQMAIAGLFYHLYNQLSYMVLDQGISPVTFSVGNTMKRVSVVVASVLFFRNPVSALNWVGSGVAIAGTFLYSLAEKKMKDERSALKPATA